MDDTDRDWFNDILKTKIEEDFGRNPTKVLGNKIILFGDFLDPSLDVRLYVQISDMDKVSCWKPSQGGGKLLTYMVNALSALLMDICTLEKRF